MALSLVGEAGMQTQRDGSGAGAAQEGPQPHLAGGGTGSGQISLLRVEDPWVTLFSPSLKTTQLPRPISWKLPLKLLSGARCLVRQCLSDQRDMVNEGRLNISCECVVEREVSRMEDFRRRRCYLKPQFTWIPKGCPTCWALGSQVGKAKRCILSKRRTMNEVKGEGQVTQRTAL